MKQTEWIIAQDCHKPSKEFILFMEKRILTALYKKGFVREVQYQQEIRRLGENI